MDDPASIRTSEVPLSPRYLVAEFPSQAFSIPSPVFELAVEVQV